MATESAQAAVTATPGSLASGGSNGVRVRLFNAGAVSVFLGGGTAVSTSTGLALASSTSLDWYVEQGDDLYAVVASGTATVHVLRGGV